MSTTPHLLDPAATLLAGRVGLPHAALGYGLAAAACVSATIIVKSLRKQAPPATGIWYGCALCLAVLAVNAALQADQLLILWMRELASEGHWYQNRRTIQAGVLAILLPACLLGAGRVWKLVCQDRTAEHARLAAIGLFGLVLIQLLRAVSLHQTDLLLNLRIAGVTAGRLLDLVGMALILLGATREVGRAWILRD